MVRTNFYFPKSMLDQLRRIKEITGVPVSVLIRKAVERHLDEIEASLALHPTAGVRVKHEENDGDQ
jgi:predicted DNA-binding protein